MGTFVISKVPETIFFMEFNEVTPPQKISFVNFNKIKYIIAILVIREFLTTICRLK